MEMNQYFLMKKNTDAAMAINGIETRYQCFKKNT